jgi:acyl carrier protein
LSRDEVVTMLATFGSRSPDAVTERIDSLELAWLLNELDRRYGISLDPTDEVLDQMGTVTGAVEVLRDVPVRIADV